MVALQPSLGEVAMPIKIPVHLEVYDNYADGEIFWSKAIGRPETATLSEGFKLEAFQEIWFYKIPVLPDDPDPFERKPWPRTITWWDGQDDDEYWRIEYLAGDLVVGKHPTNPEFDLYTHIHPTLIRTVPWTYPGGRFGIASNGSKELEPPGAHFVKTVGVVRPKFEVVVKRWWNP
jgi:hypothetical protein